MKYAHSTIKVKWNKEAPFSYFFNKVYPNKPKHQIRSKHYLHYKKNLVIAAFLNGIFCYLGLIHHKRVEVRAATYKLNQASRCSSSQRQNRGENSKTWATVDCR